MEPNAIHILTDLEMFLDGLAKVYEYEWVTGVRSYADVKCKAFVILEIKVEFNLTLPKLDELLSRLYDAFRSQKLSC